MKSSTVELTQEEAEILVLALQESLCGFRQVPSEVERYRKTCSLYDKIRKLQNDLVHI